MPNTNVSESKVEYMVIDPDFAKMILKNNYSDNRRVRKSWVRQLAHMMEAGTFNPDNGQTIVLGTDGTLYDGQHRLHAIVESGIPQKMLVVWVEDGEEAFKTIDNGSRRMAGDFVGTVEASIAKAVLCLKEGSQPLLTSIDGKMERARRCDRIEVIDFYGRDKDAIDEAAQAAIVMRKALGFGSQAVFGAFFELVRFVGRQSHLHQFVYQFTLPASDSPTVQSLKFKLASARGNARATKMKNRMLLGMLLDAYEHYCKGDGATALNKGALRLEQYDNLLADRRNQLRQHNA